MNNNLTDLTILVDRSGSMSSVKGETEQGINSFVESQKAVLGECTLTLIQFDNEVETLFTARPLTEVKPFTLSPRGGTALLDALGKAIEDTGKRLAAMEEKDRPGLVMMVVVTDGQENMSRSYTKAKIKEMIDHQQNTYKWIFSFLGANQDSFAEAGGLGFKAMDTANMTLAKNANWSAGLSSKTTSYRGMSATCGMVTPREYTEEELKDLAGTK